MGVEIFEFCCCWQGGRDGEEKGREGEDGELHFGRFLGGGLRWAVLMLILSAEKKRGYGVN